MQEKYTKEEAKSLSVGLYVALALIAGTIFFTSQRKEIEHAESGDYYALTPVSDVPTACRSATRSVWPA